MGIFDSGSPGISVALDVPWPANVSSGPGVQVDKTNAQWLVGLDFPDLVDGGSPATPSNVYLAGYDTALSRYEKLRLDNVIAGASGVDARTALGNADYAVLTSDRYLGLAASLTAIRTITLPAASTVPPGRLVTLQDETGGITDAFYLAIAITGGDTINGGSSWTLKTTRGGATFRSNGSNAWNVLVPTGRSPVADANYTATRGDQMIAYTSISTARTVTLSAASAFQVGQRLMVVDESGSCSGTNTITVGRAGSDTINGVTSTAIGQAYGYVAVESDGVSKWTIVDSAALSSGTITSSQISDSTPLGRTDIGATRAVVGNAAYTILATDRLVVTSVALTLPRIWTLPLANAVPAGTEITLSDEVGVATTTNTVSIARAGSDTINGATGNQVVLGIGPNQKVSVFSDGVSNWALSGLAGVFTTLSVSLSASLSPSGTVTINPTTAGTMDNVSIGSVIPAAAVFTQVGVASGVFPVSGRITLTSATPVLSAAVTASANVIWAPYRGNMVPIYNGSTFIWTACGELTNILANSAVGNAGPAAAAASKVYDLYIWSNGGTPTLTRSPDWSAGGGSNTARGTGAGSAQQNRTGVGTIVNAVAITNGPGANLGTYVGTFATDAGGATVTFNPGSSAAGGGAAVINLWNNYNRVTVNADVRDSTGSWATGSASTTVNLNSGVGSGLGNRITFVSGQAEEGPYVTHWRSMSSAAAAGAFGDIGFGLDATAMDAAARAGPSSAASAKSTPAAMKGYTPLLGSHFLQATQAGDGTNANTLLGGAFGSLEMRWVY